MPLPLQPLERNGLARRRARTGGLDECCNPLVARPARNDGPGSGIEVITRRASLPNEKSGSLRCVHRARPTRQEASWRMSGSGWFSRFQADRNHNGGVTLANSGLPSFILAQILHCFSSICTRWALESIVVMLPRLHARWYGQGRGCPRRRPAARCSDRAAAGYPGFSFRHNPVIDASPSIVQTLPCHDRRQGDDDADAKSLGVVDAASLYGGLHRLLKTLERPPR